MIRILHANPWPMGSAADPHLSRESVHPGGRRRSAFFTRIRGSLGAPLIRILHANPRRIGASRSSEFFAPPATLWSSAHHRASPSNPRLTRRGIPYFLRRHTFLALRRQGECRRQRVSPGADRFFEEQFSSYVLHRFAIRIYFAQTGRIQNAIPGVTWRLEKR